MKKIIAILLCWLLIVNVSVLFVSAEEATSGTWGQLSWVLDENGTLTISGEGEMVPDSDGDPKWDIAKVKTAIIEEGVTSVGVSVFKSHMVLTKVILPDSVTRIGKAAFNNCASLQEIVLPDALTVIEGDAFSYCRLLSSINIPESVETIGEAAFLGCGLLRLTIPKNVKSIAPRAFSGTGIVEITVDKDNPVYHSKGNCLIETASKTVIAGCRKSVIPEGVEAISEYAFSGLMNLSEVIIPSTVTTIGYKAFYECRSLKKVVIPSSVTELGNWAFDSCYYLKQVVINSALTDIGVGVFDSCVDLEQIVIPESVEVIGSGAFFRCSKINVYYTGSAEKWNGVKIEYNNSVLKDCPITFNFVQPKGDANGDLAANNLDATMMLKYDAGLVELDVAEKTAADFNGDGKVNNLDAVMILKYDAGLI